MFTQLTAPLAEERDAGSDVEDHPPHQPFSQTTTQKDEGRHLGRVRRWEVDKAVPLSLGVAQDVEQYQNLLVSSILQSAQALVSTISSVFQNGQQAADLKIRIQDLVTNLSKLGKARISPQTATSLEPIQVDLRDIEAFMKELSSKNTVSKFWKRHEIAAKLRELTFRLDTHSQSFLLCASVRTEDRLMGILNEFKSGHSNEDRLNQVRSARLPATVEDGLNDIHLVPTLPPAYEAPSDKYSSSPSYEKQAKRLPELNQPPRAVAVRLQVNLELKLGSVLILITLLMIPLSILYSKFLS